MLSVPFELYLINVFSSTLILLTIFNFLNMQTKFKIKTILSISLILVFIFFILEVIFSDSIEFLFLFPMYLIFKTCKKDTNLISALFLSFIIHDCSLAIMTTIISNIVSQHDSINRTIIILAIIIEFIVSLLLVFMIRKLKLNDYLQEENNFLVSCLLGYTYLIMMLLIISVRYFKAYTSLINMIIIFLLIQTVFMVIIFNINHIREKELFRNKLNQEQIKNLKEYTDQLEHDQLLMRRFKHDYKNILRSLEISLENNDISDLKSTLQHLDGYSNKFLNNISTELYRDVNKIHVSYLKSLFINKLNIIVQNNISCRFECNYSVDELFIDEFDLIRILGIILDNSIESTESVNKGNIDISVVSQENGIVFLIKNSCNTNHQISTIKKRGFSTKKHHKGLGLSNIDEINKKYSNLLVQYSNLNDVFSVQITVLKE